MQRPGGESSFQGAGGFLLFGEPIDKSHGREGTAGQADIVAAVEEAGYGAAPKASEAKGKAASGTSAADDFLKDKETPLLKKRLIASLCFLVPLMYVSMGHMMWN